MHTSEIILSDKSNLPPIIIRTQVVEMPNLTDYGHIAGRYRSAPQTMPVSLPYLSFMEPKCARP
jgi:hypothetical protein